MANDWTEERRQKASARAKAQMADPARAALQSQVMKRNRGRMERARREKTYTPEWRERQGLLLRELRDCATIEHKRKEGARRGTKHHQARKRGGDIPSGYEAEYRYLLRIKKLPAGEALRVVRAQRGADLRGS